MSAGYDLVKGLKVTFKELFKKSGTDKYPKEFRNKPQRFHGRHVLNKYTTSYRDSYPSLDLLDPWMVYDAYNIQKYDPGGAYHLIHCENCGGPNDIKRVMAWMIYLNTVTDKGGTYFSSYNKTIKAKEGRLVIWPAYFTHPHKGVVSKTQTKYIATGWYNFVN